MEYLIGPSPNCPREMKKIVTHDEVNVPTRLWTRKSRTYVFPATSNMSFKHGLGRYICLSIWVGPKARSYGAILKLIFQGRYALSKGHVSRPRCSFEVNLQSEWAFFQKCLCFYGENENGFCTYRNNFKLTCQLTEKLFETSSVRWNLVGWYWLTKFEQLFSKKNLDKLGRKMF